MAMRQLVFVCRLKAAKLQTRAEELRLAEHWEKVLAARAELSDNTRGLARAFAKLRASKGKPIGFLADSTGTITAHPAEIDQILQEGWQHTYSGNVADHADLVIRYIAKTVPFLYMSEAPHVPVVTGRRLLEELTAAASSAASWGQWEHDAWAALALEAVGGAKWPQQTKWDKACLLFQVEVYTADPLVYGGLL